MNYEQFKAFYARRKADNDYKKIYHWGYIWPNTDGSFDITLPNWTEVLPRPQNGRYRYRNERPDSDKRTFFRVHPNNTVEVVRRLWGHWSQGNLLAQVLGGWGAYVESDTKKYHDRKYKVRYKGRSLAGSVCDVPFTPGLIIDMTTRMPVRHAQDYEVATDRRHCQPVYAYVRAVMNLMDVMFRIELLDPKKLRATEAPHTLWVDARRVSSYLPSGATAPAMADDNLHNYAEIAFAVGARARGFPSYSSVFEARQQAYARVRRCAKERLTAYLKEAHQGYILTPIPPAPGAAVFDI